MNTPPEPEMTIEKARELVYAAIDPMIYQTRTKQEVDLMVSSLVNRIQCALIEKWKEGYEARQKEFKSAEQFWQEEICEQPVYEMPVWDAQKKNKELKEKLSAAKKALARYREGIWILIFKRELNLLKMLSNLRKTPSGE